MLIQNFNSFSLFSFIVQILNPISGLAIQNSHKRKKPGTQSLVQQGI